MLFYNVDLFKKSGVPLPPTTWDAKGWTFDEFVDNMRKLTQYNATPQVFGCSLYDGTANEQTFTICNGSPTGIYSADGRKFTMADPPGYEAMQWIADLTHKYRVQPTRAIAAENKSIDNMFSSQLLATRFTGTQVIFNMRRDANFTWDVAPVPMKAKRAQETGFQTVALATGAANPDNGWRLINFFTEAEASKIFIDTGYVIPAKKAFAKDYVEANKGKPPANISVVIDALNYQTRPNQTLDTPGARLIYRGENLNQIWDGKVTAQEGFTRVRAAVEAAIAPK
jgi:multiple sugar transport system substrate-binding protein